MKPQSPGYLWAEFGAIVGVVAFVVPVAALWIPVSTLTIEDDERLFAIASGLAIISLGAGGVLGCRFALRKRKLPHAEQTSLILAWLLGILYLVGWWSSNTELQSDLLPYLAGMALLMPALARRITLLRRHSRRISG